MNRQILPAIFCVIAAICSLSAARATVLVYEGFHPADYDNVPAGGEAQVNTTFTAGHTIGVSTSKWGGPSGAMTKVYGENHGLSFSSKMAAYGFKAIGGSVGMSPGSNSTDMRAKYHSLVSNVLKAQVGTNLYFRVLLNVDSAAAGQLPAVNAPASNNVKYFACGFTQTDGSDYYLLTHKKSALSFVVWKNQSNQYVLSFAHTTASDTTATFYPLVTGITLGETYVCYAEVKVGAGTDGKEIVRAGAVEGTFTGEAPWATIGDTSDSIEVELISDSSFPTVMAVAGPYGTNSGYFRADEFVVGTELGDILPVGSLFAAWPIGASTVGTTSFSNDWALFADGGVTADAGLVWSVDESFSVASTNSLGTGLAAGTRTASLTELEPDTAYWWKIYADNGTEIVETPVGSFKTTGAPVLGNATATAAEETATFSVALAEAAMENTLTTSVSVFYGTNGVDWTEFPLGSASSAETFSGTVENLGCGVTYQWFARATATMEGGRVLSDSTATNTFTTLWNGDMYVDAASANVIKPYNTPGTAAKTIAAAMSAAASGATIHIAPGLYPVSLPIAVNKAICILGDDPDPSRVVVSNTANAGSGGGDRRVFTLNHANAIVANLTMKNGMSWGTSGSCFLVDSNGGTVSNCVVEAGQTKGNGAVAAGGCLNAGFISHTVFRRCTVASDTTSDKNQSYRPAVLLLKNASRAENCLFVDNTQSAGKALTLIRLENNATLRNCTIVDSGLGNTNQYCAVFTPIYINSANATVQNVVVAGVTNRIDGALCRPAWGRPANFLNGATDADISGLGFLGGTVVGTAESFFNDYANGDYTLNPASLLVNAGANYEGMASVDLAGNPRKVGSRIDIGCYELRSTPLVIIIR